MHEHKNYYIIPRCYDLLARRKEGKESFSDVVRKLAKPKSLLEFAGMLTHEQAQNIREEIAEYRKRSEENQFLPVM